MSNHNSLNIMPPEIARQRHMSARFEISVQFRPGTMSQMELRNAKAQVAAALMAALRVVRLTAVCEVGPHYRTKIRAVANS